MADIPGPTYHAIKNEIVKVTGELAVLKPTDPVQRARLAAALRDLETAYNVLYCGQTQSALDPGAAPPDTLLARIESGGDRDKLR